MRRTKEEAAKTRDAIVEAALACFDARGIAHATLDEIAAKAGVTKGAVYHHFGGKPEILHEIRMRVSLPLLDKADTALLAAGPRPALERVERFLLAIVDILETDARTRRALRVMHFKCEYVGDLQEELASMLRNHRHLLEAFESAYRQARIEGALRPGVTPHIAAITTVVFLNGLVRLWLFDAGRDGVRRNAREAVRTHMQLRTLTSPRAAARRPRGRKPA
jgi:TetR/AcrR family acrAB operon transcriptional repressor